MGAVDAAGARPSFPQQPSTQGLSPGTCCSLPAATTGTTWCLQRRSATASDILPTAKEPNKRSAATCCRAQQRGQTLPHKGAEQTMIENQGLEFTICVVLPAVDKKASAIVADKPIRKAWQQIKIVFWSAQQISGPIGIIINSFGILILGAWDFACAAHAESKIPRPRPRWEAVVRSLASSF